MSFEHPHDGSYFFADPESGTILVIVAILRPKLFLKLCFLDATVWLGGKIKPSVKPSQVWRKLFSTTDAICLLGIDTSNDVSLAKIKSSGLSSGTSALYLVASNASVATID